MDFSIAWACRSGLFKLPVLISSKAFLIVSCPIFINLFEESALIADEVDPRREIFFTSVSVFAPEDMTSCKFGLKSFKTSFDEIPMLRIAFFNQGVWDFLFFALNIFPLVLVAFGIFTTPFISVILT